MKIIILAAGNGTRFGSELPKQFHNINGIPMFIRTINVAKNIDGSEIILAINKEYETLYLDLLKKYEVKDVKMVAGGKHRFDSIYNSIKDIKDENIIIMEAARPFASEELYKQLIDHPADNVITSMPAVQTPYKTSGGILKESINTNGLVLSTTPKKYHTSTLISFMKNKDYWKNYNDETEILLNNFVNLEVIVGSRINIKVTTAEDELLANLYAKRIDKKNRA